MSKSDPDIYAKIGGEPDDAFVVDDASPIERETPPSLVEQHESVQQAVQVTGNDWSLAYIERQSVGTTVAFVDPAHIQAGDEPGTITVPDSGHVIRRDGTASLATTEATVLSLQRVSNALVNEHTDQREHSGEQVITSDPLASGQVTPGGPNSDPLYHHGRWFVARDANNRDRDSHNCYETYFPEEALQFRDAERFDRPPYLAVSGECLAPEWDGPSGDFGIVSTEIVRVSTTNVPASDERIREIEHNAQ